MSEGPTRRKRGGAILFVRLSRSRRWKASRFTGWRSPSRGCVGTWTLVGPSVGIGFLPCQPPYRRHRTSRGLPRKGTLSACALRSACTRREVLHRMLAHWLTTRPSLGPRTRAGHSPRVNPSGKPVGGGALELVSRSGKLGESQEEPAPGLSRVDPVRLAAPHRSRKGARVRRQKRKGVTAPVPARIVRARGSCPHVVLQLQKSIGDAWSRRSSSNALQKERQGRVNGDLERRGIRRSHVGCARTVETANRAPGLLRTNGSKIG